MASLVLEHDNWPPVWRELGAAVISPPTGFNRLAFGDRFGPVFPSHDPVYYSRLQAGYAHSTQNEPGTSAAKFEPDEAVLEFAIDYGLPGKPGYTYDRPFDYFTFQATTSSANGFENLLTKGLLLGKDYEIGRNYRGVWGVYGNYDYIAPQTFRVSTTGLSFGTTGQAWLSESIALQGTVLGGAGYAAVGTTRSTSERDYNYGVAPQALVALRLILGERASIDLTGREYFVSRVAAATRGGHDNIVRVDARSRCGSIASMRSPSSTWRIAATRSIRTSATAPSRGEPSVSSTPTSATTASARSTGADGAADATARWPRTCRSPSGALSPCLA